MRDKLIGKIALYLPDCELKTLLLQFDMAAVADEADETSILDLKVDNTALIDTQAKKALQWLDTRLTEWGQKGREAFLESKLAQAEKKIKALQDQLNADFNDEYQLIVSRDVIIEYLARYVPEGELLDLLDLFKLAGHWRIEGSRDRFLDCDEAVEKTIRFIRRFVDEQRKPT